MKAHPWQHPLIPGSLVWVQGIAGVPDSWLIMVGLDDCHPAIGSVIYPPDLVKTLQGAGVPDPAIGGNWRVQFVTGLRPDHGPALQQVLGAMYSVDKRATAPIQWTIHEVAPGALPTLPGLDVLDGTVGFAGVTREMADFWGHQKECPVYWCKYGVAEFNTPLPLAQVFGSSDGLLQAINEISGRHSGRHTHLSDYELHDVSPFSGDVHYIAEKLNELRLVHQRTGMRIRWRATYPLDIERGPQRVQAGWQ